MVASGGSSNSGYHGTQPIIFYDKPTPNDNAQILQTASKTQKFGNPAMVGEVKNNGPDTIQFAKVTATYYDNTNRILGS